LLVFGKASGNRMIEFLKENPGHPEMPPNAADRTLQRLARLDSQKDGENVYQVAAEMRRIMQAHCGVFRFPDLLAEGARKIKQLAERAQRTQIGDKSKVFNTARVEALELDNLIEVALASLISAEARKESRGAHDRADHHQRDDVNWLKHSLWFKEGNRLDYKPVHLKPLTAESFEPKARTY
jgi:succinate dehydrogenase / fumarate reductase flavoprotein subunit